MNFPTLFAFAVLTIGTPVLAQHKAHLLKLHQPEPGQTIVVHAVSDSPNSAMTITRGASTQKGRISIKRDRTFERSIRDADAATQVVYKVLSDQVVTTIELGSDKDTVTKTLR